MTIILDSKPALYCSRTEIVDADGHHVRLFPLSGKRPSFQNGILQSIGGGNTMLFKAAAKRLLEATGHTDAVFHDWWTY
jgi:hypothetical protein